MRSVLSSAHQTLRIVCLAALALPVVGALAGPARAADTVRMLVQSSPLAGSQYYALGRVRSRMHEGDALSLEREPDNRHDGNAIVVRWQGEKLGYLPRRENADVAAAIDRGEKVRGRVRHLRDDRDPWRQLEIDVFLEFEPPLPESPSSPPAPRPAR